MTDDHGPRGGPGDPGDPDHPGPAILGEGVTLFGRMALFGLGIGLAYWLLTGETAGTVLLLAFGLGSAIAAIAILVGGRGQDSESGRGGPEHGRGAAGAAGAEAGAAAGAAGPEAPPRPGWAPIGVAAGLGGLAIGAALGPWLAIGGVLVALIAARAWLDATVRESDRARGIPPNPPVDD